MVEAAARFKSAKSQGCGLGLDVSVLFQYSKNQNIPISGAGAEPVRPVPCFVTPINVGIVKMFIVTINVILPELETVVTVTSSLYSTVL